MRAWLAILLAAGGIANAGPDDPCAGEGRVAAEAAALDAHLRRAVEERGFSGAVLVERGGVVLLCRGYGSTDRSGRHPIGPDTKFEIASITKQMTAAAVLLLVEDGRIALGDTLARFLPGLDPPKSGITIHQLLTHTAGLGHNYAMDGIAERHAAIAAILEPPLERPPGEGFDYTNNAYALLAALVEIVADQSYESFVTRRLLTPAGMTGTTFWGLVDHTDPGRFAQILEPSLSEAMLEPNWGLRGCAGIFSSATDLYDWYRAAWRGDLLGPESRERMFTGHWTLESETGIGYGTFVSPRSGGAVELWARGTEDFGHSGVLRWLRGPDLFVLVLSNAGQLGERHANQVISDEVLAILLPGEDL